MVPLDSGLWSGAQRQSSHCVGDDAYRQWKSVDDPPQLGSG
jgi:hypothetical protein